ncbi:DUF1835 domain-containing protein [Bacillus smithii]|uniref:DUF1835 domain-containing protein n=1 Tax=Bacillus smithii TaxID=1479 RepID=UPI003D1A2DAB
MEIEKLKKVIKGLSEGEAKSLLFHILLRVNLLKETEYSEEGFVNDVSKIYRTISDLTNEQSESNQEGTFKMVHILFGDSPAGSLKVVLKDLGVHKEENVISFEDIFSIGPIRHLHEESGKKTRFDWIKNHFNHTYGEFFEYKQKFQRTIHQIKSIPEGKSIAIWVAENSHEQTGLRYVLHLLKEKNNAIKVINTTKTYAEHFNRLDTEYVVLHTGEIPPEKLQVIYGQSKQKAPLSQLERERFEQEWLSLAENDEALRIWQKGRILSVPEDYYDQYMINSAKKLHSKQKANDFMKSARLIGEVLGHLEQYVGDEFLEYRLRRLIEKGVFEMEGSLKAMRCYSIKLRSKK